MNGCHHGKNGMCACRKAQTHSKLRTGEWPGCALRESAGQGGCRQMAKSLECMQRMDTGQQGPHLLYPGEAVWYNGLRPGLWHFPGDPVARTLCSQCRKPGFSLWSGNYIPHTTTIEPTCHNEDWSSHLPLLRPSAAK